MTAMRKLLTAIVAAAACVLATSASAQTYPSKPITVIVPFAAGGATDVLARFLGERLRTILGQPIIVENVTGAGGSIGVTRLVRAPADGTMPVTLPKGQRAGLLTLPAVMAAYAQPDQTRPVSRGFLRADRRPRLQHSVPLRLSQPRDRNH